MAQDWNDTTLPWQTWDGTNHPWKNPAMPWNDTSLPWKALPISLNLSASTVSDAATVGTTIGTLSVTGGSGSFTYSLTSNPGTLFSITGSALKVAATLTAGSDPITVRADNGAGSVVSRAFLITVTSSSGTTGQSVGLLLALTKAA